MENNKKGNGCILVFVVIVVIAMGFAIFGSCGNSRSSGSNKKWSELTEQEKDNARWAYEAKQAIEDYKNK